VREFKMPEGVQHDQISSSYSSDGILTISAPRVINAPGKGPEANFKNMTSFLGVKFGPFG
jgi:HSP20 family molecular chaperone IbpA